MKTPMSRFHIHDELTAPEGSVPVLRGALATGGQLPNFLGVLAGSPAALRAYARFRSELRHGTLTLPTLERIALAVAAALPLRAGHGDAQPHRAPGRASRWTRSPSPREWDSRDEREAALMRYLKRARRDASPSRRCTSTRRHARRAGPTSRSSRRSRRPRWRRFTAMVNVAGEVPVDGSWEDSRRLRAA